MRRWDKEANALVDVQAVRRTDESKNWIDVGAAYLWEDGVKRQVWPMKLWLYKSGDSGIGWVPAKMFRGATFTKAASYLRLYTPYSNVEGTCMAQARSQSAINISDYTKITVYGESNLYDGGSTFKGHFLFCLLNNTDIDHTYYWGTSFSPISEIKESQIRITVDISQFSGNKYIGLILNNGAEEGKYVNIREIYLEK